MVMKTNKIQRNSQALNAILFSIIFLWLAVITKYAIDSRDYQQQQAKNDSEAIYQTMVEQGKQRAKLEELGQ